MTFVGVGTLDKPTKAAPGRTCEASVYNGSTVLNSYRTQLLIALAIVVFAFGSLDPYLDAASLCGLGGCPIPVQSSDVAPGGANTGFSGACMVAVLAFFLAASGFARSSGDGRAADQRRPSDAHLPPETPPPRLPESR